MQKHNSENSKIEGVKLYLNIFKRIQMEQRKHFIEKVGVQNYVSTKQHFPFIYNFYHNESYSLKLCKDHLINKLIKATVGQRVIFERPSHIIRERSRSPFQSGIRSYLSWNTETRESTLDLGENKIVNCRKITSKILLQIHKLPRSTKRISQYRYSTIYYYVFFKSSPKEY